MTLRELIDYVKDRGFFNKTASHILILNTDWADQPVEEVFRKYLNVVREMSDLPGDDEYVGSTIVIDQVTADGTSYPDVYMKDESDARWGLDFIDWNSLIDLKVEDRISTEVSEMLAHVLYEITWWGYTRRSIKDQADEMVKAAEEAGNLIEFSLSGID